MLWIKGSGGDIGRIQRKGFATLYLDKLFSLTGQYRGVQFEDEMVDLYPICTFGTMVWRRRSIRRCMDFCRSNTSIICIRIGALRWRQRRTARRRWRSLIARYGHKLVWLPWQRPGFELAMMLRDAVARGPGCDGVVLGGHGLFTWGETQRECYVNTITIIDQLGQFVVGHVEKLGERIFGGARGKRLANHREIALDLFPLIRGRVSGKQRLIGNFNDLPEVLRFVNSEDAETLARLGTSCRITLFERRFGLCLCDGIGNGGVVSFQAAFDSALDQYRRDYGEVLLGVCRR